MILVIIIIAMIIVGLIVGALAGIIWKDNRPIGVKGDYIAAVISAIVMGLIDWYLIPALGFSDLMRNLGVIFEPPLTSLLVLWIIRKAKQ
jgi:uncharacterized membrane protein YeaQ/YmgE (transglycosylase-associated protein family)